MYVYVCIAALVLTRICIPCLVSFYFILKSCSFKTCFDTGGDQLGGCFGDQRWMAWSLLWDSWCLGLNPFCIHITQWGNVEVITPQSNHSIELFTLKSKIWITSSLPHARSCRSPNFCTQKLANIIHIWPHQLTFAGKPQITKKIHKPLFEFRVGNWQYTLLLEFQFFFCSKTWIWFHLPVPTAQDIRGCANMGCTTNTKMGHLIKKYLQNLLTTFSKKC